ncbi:MAG: (Fe-S)-binding protein, partial [Methanomassiliicoccales archaeon]|nr:(Fe-S)-binding protein [Methanomassiliicoccales archaeon]
AFDQKVAYLGKDEGCCGSVLLKTGQRQAYLRTKKRAIDAISVTGATKIVTGCPGCFATLASWKSEGLGIKVEHISQTVDRLLEAHPDLFRTSDELVTYHDPCDLGRQGGVYNEPRRLLRSVPGTRVVEMGHNRDRALCCGSGGGVKTAFPRLAGAIASKRIAEAKATGAKTLVTACPWCESNLNEAARATGSGVDVVDLVSFLVARLNVR